MDLLCTGPNHLKRVSINLLFCECYLRLTVWILFFIQPLSIVPLTQVIILVSTRLMLNILTEKGICSNGVRALYFYPRNYCFSFYFFFQIFMLKLLCNVAYKICYTLLSLSSKERNNIWVRQICFEGVGSPISSLKKTIAYSVI